jgi:hypothetical protein
MRSKGNYNMWICNNNQKVITGPLKTLLINAAHFMINDMVGFDLPQDMRNKKTIEEIIQTLNEEDEIIADLNPIFENLSPFEKIYATHYVLTHLFNSKVKAPALSLWMEGTVDVLFNIIISSIKVEIDDEDEIDQEKFKYRMRKLVVEAAKQYSSEKDICKKNIEKIKNADFWIYQIDILRSLILSVDAFEDDMEDVEAGTELKGEHLPTIKIEKKTIVKMINDILKMKP